MAWEENTDTIAMHFKEERSQETKYNKKHWTERTGNPKHYCYKYRRKQRLY